jgi:hypothetical protein
MKPLIATLAFTGVAFVVIVAANALAGKMGSHKRPNR